MMKRILNVEWENDFRFLVIQKPPNRAKRMPPPLSHHAKGSRVDYCCDRRHALNQRQRVPRANPLVFLLYLGQVEVVCFVVQTTLPRLTLYPTLHFRIDPVDFRHKDIRDNIGPIVAFANASSGRFQAGTDRNLKSLTRVLKRPAAATQIQHGQQLLLGQDQREDGFARIRSMSLSFRYRRSQILATIPAFFRQLR